MASYPNPTLPSSSQIPTAATPVGVKCERENGNDDEEQGPPPRKRVTISRKTCIVCTEEVPKNRFPKLPRIQDEKNKHSSDVCFKCFGENLCVEVETKDHEKVGCPQCSKPLEEPDIRKLASNLTYEEYVRPDFSQRYPEGFWNHMNLLDAVQTPRDNENPPEIQIESQSTTRTDSPEAATALSEDGEGDDATERKEEATKKKKQTNRKMPKRINKEGKGKKRREKKVPAESLKECTICLEIMATDRYPDLPHADESEHSSDVCHVCWE